MRKTVVASLIVGFAALSVTSCSGKAPQPQETSTPITSGMDVPDSARAETAKVHEKQLLIDLAKLHTQEEKVKRILRDDCEHPGNVYTMVLYDKYAARIKGLPMLISNARLTSLSPCRGVPVG